MPVSPTQVTAWLSVQIYTRVEHDFCMTCYERPPVLRDRFCWAEGVVAQDKFYCNPQMTLKNHVLVTSFTINNKSTFVQRCLIGNLLSVFFNGFTM